MAGARVAMIDGGGSAPGILGEAPLLNFEDMRRVRSDQHRWFLGNDFSGIPLDGVGEGLRGSVVSGNRNYIVDRANRLLPVATHNVQAIQALAEGGLGAAWGAVCSYFGPEELQTMGLPSEEMDRHYAIVSERIGVSGPQTRPGIQPPVRLDHHAKILLESYELKKSLFGSMQTRVTQPHLAVLTVDKGSRKAAAYRDMEFWADPERSIYRPQFTIEELETKPNFIYIGNRLVWRVEERGNECLVYSKPIDSGNASDERTDSASYLILAAGAIGTARILLHSFDLYDVEIPFLAKPHIITACWHQKTLGRAGDPERLSLCQLLVIDERRGAGYAQLYSYKSLQNIRLVRLVPLPIPEALQALSLITPSLVLADIRFPVLAGPGRTLKLIGGHTARDYLYLQASHWPEEEPHQAESLKRIHRALRHLGLQPFKSKKLPPGSTAHYGGTVPFNSSPSTYPLSVDRSGKLHQADRIYVADSSVFCYLPAQSLTLTIMANANRVGEKVLQALNPTGATNAGPSQSRQRHKADFVGD
jgi:hypothetical protein